MTSSFLVTCGSPLRDQAEAFGVGEGPAGRFQHAFKGLARKSVTAVVVMDDGQTAVLMHVDAPSCAS